MSLRHLRFPGDSGYSSEDQAAGAFQLPWQPAGILSTGASLPRAPAGSGVSSARTSGVTRAGEGRYGSPKSLSPAHSDVRGDPYPAQEADRGCSRSTLQRRVGFGVQSSPE